jgi:hypothetical protein
MITDPPFAHSAEVALSTSIEVVDAETEIAEETAVGVALELLVFALLPQAVKRNTADVRVKAENGDDVMGVMGSYPNISDTLSRARREPKTTLEKTMEFRQRCQSAPCPERLYTLNKFNQETLAPRLAILRIVVIVEFLCVFASLFCSIDTRRDCWLRKHARI